MKSAIIFYSYSGNTVKVAMALAETLEAAGPVDVIRLKPADESDSFFGQVARALFKKTATIEDVQFDLNAYSLICLGTPVWAFGMTPAMRRYIEKCSGIEDKDIILFTTYGSGTGNNKCLNEMQAILSKKGVRGFRRFSVSQFKVNNRDFVKEKIKKILPL